MIGRTRAFDLMVKIVSAHVRHNQVPVDALPALIENVYYTLTTVGADLATKTPTPEKQQPAAPVKRSVFSDYIVCLEDGRKLKMLKRHLQTVYNMTPDEYRTRWGLPSNYPMVAPSYANYRSAKAKSLGFGQKPAASETAGPKSAPTVTYVPARRARGSRW
jgi:predicted transcriptional regulator